MKSVPATAVSLFFLGLGWNLSFVSASSELLDLAAPAERGRLVGFNDQLASLPAASLALLYGFVLSESGLVAFALAPRRRYGPCPIAFVGGRPPAPSAVASEPRHLATLRRRRTAVRLPLTA